MGKCNWTIDTIEKKIEELEKMLGEEQDRDRFELIRNDLNFLNGYVEDYYDQTPLEMTKLLESYRYLKESLLDKEFIWDDVLKFRSITKKPFVLIPDAKKASLSRGDILDLTHDFYKSLDPFFYNKFMKNFKRRRDHVAFRRWNMTEIKGETLSITSKGEAYIEIFRDYTLDDVLTTIHEYGHAVATTINPRHLLYSKNLYTEIDSIFMEYTGADYLEALMQNGEATLLKASSHEEYCCMAEIIASQIRLLKYELKSGKEFTSNKALKMAAEKSSGLLPIELEDMLNNPGLNTEIYLTSYLFALELYKLFRTDRDKALYYLKKIILLDCKTQEEYYSNIKRFGLVPNLSMKEFHQEITQDVIRLTRKKTNRKK